MKVIVLDHQSNTKRTYAGHSHEILQKLHYAYPWTKKTSQTVGEAIRAIDAVQIFSAYQLEDVMAKAEAKEAAYTIDDMHGFQPEFSPEFEAARFLSGHSRVDHETARRGLYEEDSDLERAALRAYGLDVNKDNLKALEAIVKIADLKKADLGEMFGKKTQIDAVTEAGRPFADMISRAFQEGNVMNVKLGGKHSQGSRIVTDGDNRRRFLLKPGSNAQSPAAGAEEELASQSAREAAWWHVADAWGIGHWYPQSELVSIDGVDTSVQALLPFTFASVDRRAKIDPPYLQRLFAPMLSSGDLLKWSVLDLVCGNPDRHNQNIMADEDGTTRLIDHGSAFAGVDFDPSHDKNSFVPGYLRAWAPNNFHKLPDADKLKYMPKATTAVSNQVAQWVLNMEPAKLAHILQEYQVNPGPSVQRLEIVRHLASDPGQSFSEGMNKLWVRGIHPK